MSGGEERIIEEIREFKNDVKADISKIFETMGDLNNRIISTEKDFEYLKIDLDNKTGNLETDLNNFFNLFKEFKKKELPIIIDNHIEKRINRLFVMAAINLFSLMGAGLGFIIYEFVLKR